MNIQYKFDQPVLLQQTPTWSRAIAWTIVGVSTFTVIWASVFQIDESIHAIGKLEPQGAVKEGQQVDVRIDSFPFQEYGDIKGELIEIGSDALLPRPSL